MSAGETHDNASSIKALMGVDEERVIVVVEGNEVEFHLKAPTAMQVAEIISKYKEGGTDSRLDIDFLELCIGATLPAQWASKMSPDDADKLIASAYRLTGFPNIAKGIEMRKDARGGKKKKTRLQKMADKGVVLGPGAEMEGESNTGGEDEPSPLSSK